MMPTPPPVLQQEPERNSQDHSSNNCTSQVRRKIQNRKNQRAHRNRLRQRDPDYVPKPISFQTGRLRLDELEFDDEDVEASSSSALPAAPMAHGAWKPPSGESLLDKAVSNPPPFVFPLSTDHLLHLIQYNVFRGLLSNLDTLKCLLFGWSQPSTPTDLSTYLASGPYRREMCVYPINPHIPPSLMPTLLQQICMHSAWISFLPFPRMRDNLIEREGSFDRRELLMDLMGEIINITPSQPPLRKVSKSGVFSHRSLYQMPLPTTHDDDEITSNRKGLIVWGEPHDMRNWEATPGFLAKWHWVVDGCSEVVESSNRWRAIRGEEPLSIPPAVPSQQVQTDLT